MDRKTFYRYLKIMMLLLLLVYLTSCSGKTETAEDTDIEEKITETVEEKNMLRMKIDDTDVEVEWEDNEAVTALQEIAADRLIINMSMYGGFEQVGAIGQSLPHDDVNTTTQAGDIVLYASDQLVVFYGSNSWAYTRLGHISNKSEAELNELLSHHDVTITLYLD